MLDLNIMLDLAQHRTPHYEASAAIINDVLNQRHSACLPAHALTTIHYLITKFDSSQTANDFVDWMLSHFEVESATKTVFLRARTLVIFDFEDAVVASMAESAHCDYIVTRNVSDFIGSPIPAINPEEFLLLD